MAKIGLLYLQRGRWRERQVVSAAWVLDSTRKHNDGGEPANASYGYLWWTRTTRDGLLAYFAAGYQSQLILNSGPQPRDRAVIRLHPSRRSREVYQRRCAARGGPAAGGRSVCRALGSVTGRRRAAQDSECSWRNVRLWAQT
jgi:hypothetical protein